MLAVAAEVEKFAGGEEAVLIGRVKGGRKADVLLDVLVEFENADLVLKHRLK